MTRAEKEARSAALDGILDEAGLSDPRPVALPVLRAAYNAGFEAGAAVNPIERAASRAAKELARSFARARSCPKCGAGPWEKCIGSRGQPRESNHKARVRG